MVPRESNASFRTRYHAGTQCFYSSKTTQTTRARMVTKDWRTKIQAIEGPHLPLLRIATILRTLNAKLKDQTGMKSLISALKWPFTKAEIKYFTQEITRDI